jgi:SAM-dependent methyltransferase
MSDDDILREMRAYYEARAPLHDGYMGYSDNESMELVLSPIVERVVELLSGRDVLEVACGTGNWTQVLARRARSVVAIDASETALELARRKVAGGERVEFVRADAFALDGLGGSFGGAFASDWLSHVPVGSMRSFLDNVHLRLAGGSPVVFLDILARDHPDLTPYRRDRDGNTICRRVLPDGREFDVVRNYPSESEIRAYLGPDVADLDYREWAELSRWMVSYALPEAPRG